MADVILSPDGKFMHVNGEWIPAPPTGDEQGVVLSSTGTQSSEIPLEYSPTGGGLEGGQFGKMSLLVKNAEMSCDFELAKSHCRKWKDVAVSLNDERQKSLAELNLIRLEHNPTEPEGTLFKLHDIIATSQLLGDLIIEAEVECLRAEILSCSDWVRGKEHIQKAEGILDSIGDIKGANKARLYRARREAEGSIELEEAMTIITEIETSFSAEGDFIDYSDCQYVKGIIGLKSPNNNIDNCRAIFEDGLRISETNNYLIGEARNCSGIGRTYHFKTIGNEDEVEKTKCHEKAAEWFSRSIALSRRIGLLEEEAMDAYFYGESVKGNNVQIAIQSYNRALDIAERIGATHIAYLAIYELGSTYSEIEDYDSFNAIVERKEAIFPPDGNDDGAGDVLWDAMKTNAMVSEVLSEKKFEIDGKIASTLAGATALKLKGVTFTPNIPARKMKNILAPRFDASPLVEPGDVWIVIDDTNLGSAKDSLIVTSYGLFWKWSLDEPGHLPWRVGMGESQMIVTEFIAEKNFASSTLYAVIDGDTKMELATFVITPKKTIMKMVAVLDVLANDINGQHPNYRTLN